ncbi:MAG TPA: shikimate dehydrogenase [Polyangiales bacterium]|nr:shikimate dehydrogenase [Polyangiales bacterium]
MDVYAILGHPIAHSLSPAMHNRAFETLKIDARYVPFQVPPPHLPDAVRGLRALGIRGANITLPHKTALIPLLDAIDETAQKIGAVNTLWREGDRLLGTNTDAEGLTRSLLEAGVQLGEARATVLGAGGAARAAIVGLAQAGVRRLHVAARKLERAQALIDDLRPKLGPTELSALTLETAELTRAFAETDLLIQATSATLESDPQAEPFARSLPLHSLPKSAVVTDLVYRPIDTALLRAAAALHLTTVDGLGMLLHQGALAFERWTGQRAPLSPMRAALLAGLQHTDM